MSLCFILHVWVLSGQASVWLALSSRYIPNLGHFLSPLLLPTRLSCHHPSPGGALASWLFLLPWRLPAIYSPLTSQSDFSKCKSNAATSPVWTLQCAPNLSSGCISLFFYLTEQLLKLAPLPFLQYSEQHLPQVLCIGAFFFLANCHKYIPG